MSDPYQNVERFDPDYKTGLSSTQAKLRADEGLSNQYKNNKTKSYRQIFKDNLLTFFNILNAVLAAFIIFTGEYKELAFMIVILGNLGIGLVQEINSKRTLDKLSLLVAAKVLVIRDGAESQISAHDLVLDDIMLLKTGDQVSVDGILKHGSVEVNESLLSGESDTVMKHAGDYLYAGSYVVSGSAYARVERVGEESYANRISTGAKASTRRKSELRTDINKILRTVSFIVIPIGILMFLRQSTLPGVDLNQNIVWTVAAMIGMIPEGFFLLVSMALATSAVILAYKKTLVQDLYCIETLARVDVLCLDKTGTITEGNMCVEELIPIEKTIDSHRIIANIVGATADENSTITAIRDHFGSAQDFHLEHEISFSSARKYSGAVFQDEGTYIMGAFEFVFPGRTAEFPGLHKIVDAYAEQGSRVLVVAHSETAAVENELPAGLRPLALIRIADRVRKNAPEALRYFYEQGVDVKIISGDNPKTVAYVAQRAGVQGAENYVDATTLQTDAEIYAAVQKYSVFGRVSPAQKKQMMEALKQQGHTVAMTGDGVNDVLALKEADCSVAMASGSDAAKNISTLVLLDSDFSHMPEIVAQGRKVINNLQRVATLFITKTVYAIGLAIFSLMLLPYGYPFSPIQLTLLSFVSIGFPAFFMALEPNNTRIGGSFLLNVLKKSLPGGLCVLLSVVIVNLLSGVYDYTSGQVSTMCVVLATAAGLWVVGKVSRPFTRMRTIILLASIGIFAFAVLVMGWFFDIDMLTYQQWIILAILTAAMPFIMRLFEYIIERIARYPRPHYAIVKK